MVCIFQIWSLWLFAQSFVQIDDFLNILLLLMDLWHLASDNTSDWDKVEIYFEIFFTHSDTTVQKFLLCRIFFFMFLKENMKSFLTLEMNVEHKSKHKSSIWQ